MTRLGLILVALLSATVAAQPAVDAAITGLVLDPDSKPVTSGSVVVTSSNGRVSAPIGPTGEFKLVPDTTGRQSLVIAVPGFAMHRAFVTVPASRRMALPDIHLLQATYYRVRPISIDGEPLGRDVRWSSLDADGNALVDPAQHTRDQIEPDGTITIGPLPLGRTMFAFDRVPFAPTRLRDAIVNGTQPMIDAGTITIQPAARLQVDLVDAAGAPVKQHDVFIEDAVQPSPLSASRMTSDDTGRVVFDRLAVGRHRVWTRTPDRCGGMPLVVSRLVTANTSGLSRTRIVVGGRASLRISTPIGALLGRAVSLKPDAPAQSPMSPQLANLAGRRVVMSPMSQGCHGMTDSNGAVTLAPMPPGPADLSVQLFNSAYFRQINVPENGAEMAIEIPDGLIPVKVLDATTRRPVVAKVVWQGAGARVEAMTNANGDALLEGVGNEGGMLAISASGHQTVEGAFAETPETVQEVALTPLRTQPVVITITTEDNQPIPNAVVELQTERIADASEISTTGPNGVVGFSQPLPGVLRMRVRAEGFVDGNARIADDDRDPIRLALKRVQ